MDIFMMQYNYQSKYLVIIDGDVYVYKYEKCKFYQPFLCFKLNQNMFLLVNQKFVLSQKFLGPITVLGSIEILFY